MLKEGTYKAKAINAGLSQTKSGQPQAFVQFEVQMEDGKLEHITWFGSMNQGKALEMTIKGLVTAGFVGNDFPDLQQPFETTFTAKEVSIELEEQEYNGKSQLKVKWINNISNGPKKFQGAAPKMAAMFAKVKTEMGTKKTAKPVATESWD